MSPSRFHILATVALSWFLLTVTPSPVQGEAMPLRLDTAGWNVTFHPEAALLTCHHTNSGLTVTGQLEFSVKAGDRNESWRFAASRDAVTNRIALMDAQDNAQGYLTFTTDASRIQLHVLQRPPHLYTGVLKCRFETSLGPQSFACRTAIPEDSPVVQIASGKSDSTLNESLFDPERDLVLKFTDHTLDITTRQTDGIGPVTFTATASISTLHDESVGFEIIPHYYQSRYVPDYRLIDRKRTPSAPTGWMSWNAYFDTAGEKENLDEARIGARFLKPFGLEIWSIESWQDNSPKLPVSDFHNLTLRPSPVKFPHGMKWLAEQIREIGFRPGIWTVPFGTGDSNYYAVHKDWFLHDPQGKPMENWCGHYLLDPSQEAVRKQMEESHRTMASEWGYEFFKIDGMSGRETGYSAHFFESPRVRAAFREPLADDPYALCVQALRRGIGPDRIFLACQGHYSGPEAGVADAARLGSDIVAPNQPPHWENYLNQARISQAQLFTHNIIWYNDPDTLMVAAPAPLDMARLAATVVALPGQLTFFGDKLGTLPPERMRLLQQSLPVCDAHPLDLAPNNILRPIWDLKVQRSFAQWDVVSVFNWDEKPVEHTLKFVQLGLPEHSEYLVFDFWNHTFLGIQRGDFRLTVPARGNRLLAIHPRLDHPQFLSTDRHITQGAIEWRDTTWNATSNELTVSLNLVEHDPMTVYFHVTSNHVFETATAEGAQITQTNTTAMPVIALTLNRPTSGNAHVKLKFQSMGK